MKNAPLLNLSLVGVLCAWCVHIAPAAETVAPEVSQPNTNDFSISDIQSSLLQLQEQINALQLAIERSQQDAQVAIQRNAEDATTRFQLLEKSLTAQRADELEVMQRANHVTLVLAGTVVAVVFIAMLFTAYFQWRVVNRLSELSSIRPSLLTLASGRALSEVTADGGQVASTHAVEEANARLLGVVEQLTQRIVEFEQAARPPVKEKTRPAPARAGKA